MEEWPKAGCFLSESHTPTTPPVIESWSSSSSNDDNSQIANASASTSSKKPKKRKIRSRLQTKLNFDECVLTQHKNQQWITPKVTKILRQCHNGDEEGNSDEQREKASQSKERTVDVSIAGRIELVEKPHTETSSSSLGYVGISPGQCSVQDLIKQRPYTTTKSCTFGIPHEPSASSLSSEVAFSSVVMSSSQESEMCDVPEIEKSPDNLPSSADGNNVLLESSITQSSPIIKLSNISRIKRKRKKITSSPIISRKHKSAQKSKAKQQNAVTTAEITMLSNTECGIQDSSKDWESISNYRQVNVLQLSPIIKSSNVKRTKKLNKSNYDSSLVVTTAEKTSQDKRKEKINLAGSLLTDSLCNDSDFDSIIEDTQLSPITRTAVRLSSKSGMDKEVVQSITAKIATESPIAACSPFLESDCQDVNSDDLDMCTITRQNKESQITSKIYHSSPCAINRNKSPIGNEAENFSKRSTPTSLKSPIISQYSIKKRQKNSLKNVQKNLASSFTVSETSSESDTVFSAVVKTNPAHVPQEVNSTESQLDYVPGTQICSNVITKRRSCGKEIRTGLKDDSILDSSNPNPPMTSVSCDASNEKDISDAPFEDFLVPFPKSSIDTQNPSDYNISVDLDTQNFAAPSQSTYRQCRMKSSNLFSSDSNPINISFSTQDSMDLIINSLVGKTGNSSDCRENEAITIDSFSSQDISSDARATSPVKITTVSDLPSPKSSGYQIATCSSQSTNQTSPIRNDEPCDNMDSAKKKKRLRKGGYAAHLQKLLNRQKSASRIFQHEMLNNMDKLNEKGTKLHVDIVWQEFDKVFLHCRFSTEENKDETALLILNPNQCKNILGNSILNIFPPWQTLTMPKNSTKVITNLLNFQVIAAGDDIHMSRAETAVVKEFNCKCTNLKSSLAKCVFKLPFNGLEIFEVLYPNMSSVNVPSRLLTHATTENCDGTISELLALPSGVSDKHIDICIQRVFHFNDVEKQEICWSLLGQDSRGELSEVILPSRHDASTVYADIVVGDVYRVKVVNVTKRIHRNQSPGLWAVIDCKNMSSDGPSTSDMVPLTESDCNLKQLYIYLITASDSQENVKKLDFIFNWARHNWMKPKVSDLFSAIKAQPSDCYAVCSFRVKILFFTENILFVTDLSLSHSAESYCTVTLRPSFCVPAEVLSKKCGVVFLQDVQVLMGKLSMDRYSRIETSTDQWPSEVVQALSAEKSTFAVLVGSTVPKHLVSVSGQIIGVDEETAYEWLACVECSGNVLTVTPDGGNLCNVCNKTVASRPMMSLEILVAMGEMVVKIKLQQSSIILLLPPSQNDGEGFELARVIGKQIGPMNCLVLQSLNSKECSFILEELPTI